VVVNIVDIRGTGGAARQLELLRVYVLIIHYVPPETPVPL